MVHVYPESGLFFFFNAETGQDEWKNRMADIMLRYDL